MAKKRNERTFELLPRSLHDPKGFGDDAKGVFVEVEPKSKAITRAQLEKQADEFKLSGRRDNEGEAALYGITYDDSKYDYMQHFNPIGQHPDAIFISADGTSMPSYGRQAEIEALIQAKTQQESDLLGELNGGAAPDKLGFRDHYQAMLPIQDSIKGLRPDLDPQISEVLDALEDEAFIEGEDDDLFAELIQTGEVKNEAEWKKLQHKNEVLEQKEDEEDWEFAFRKFKLQDKPSNETDGESDLLSSAAGGFDDEERDTLGALPSEQDKLNSAKSGKKKKKRVGAKTDLTGFSMSSSANYRNEGLTLVDDAFEKIEEDYAQEIDEGEQTHFDMSKERSDFDSILDDFLDGYVVEGKHLYKK